MIQSIRSKDRYHLDTDWLSTNWHFSFDHYHDPKNTSFGPLRVFNDDLIAPGGGFPFHSHREMEIVTYVIQGAVEHHDNLGNTGIIRPGEIQRMSAGTGVIHSEYNHSKKDPVRLVQLWIFPAEKHLEPSWEQKGFSLAGRSGRLLPIAVPAGRAVNGNSNVVQIHQDATIYTALLAPGQSASHQLGDARRAYIFVVNGSLLLNGEILDAGDQARVTNVRDLQLSAPFNPDAAAADFLLLDLP